MHTCPECGQACNCGSDVDDCLLELEEDVDNCTHCPPFGGDRDRDDDDLDVGGEG